MRIDWDHIPDLDDVIRESTKPKTKRDPRELARIKKQNRQSNKRARSQRRNNRKK